ncbi:MAG: hypothetical protein H6Q16_222 [Bacteroidetes bacterium]|nr:hypothetical protein [Bacteroidota bacterium]
MLCLSIGFIACDGEDDFVFPEPFSTPRPSPAVPDYDTILPKEYFPAFPGSYWVYNNTDTLRVMEDYQLYIYRRYLDYYGVEYVDDTIVLPKFYPNSIYGDVLILRYEISNFRGSHNEPAWKGILSETLGGVFYQSASEFGNQNIGMTVAVDTTIIVNGVTYNDVIVTVLYNRAFMLPPELCFYYRDYYAKGVGLIKREETDYPPSSEVRVLFELTDYNIVR